MPHFAIRTVSDEAMGERDWMVLLVHGTNRVILAVKQSVQLAAEDWALAMEAVRAAYASVAAAA